MKCRIVFMLRELARGRDSDSSAVRSRDQYYVPTSNLTCFKKGVYFMGVNIINNLPQTIKDVTLNENRFKNTLKIPSYSHLLFC